MSLLKSLFGIKSTPQKAELNEALSFKEPNLSVYLKAEIDKASFIKQECKEIVLSHLLGENNLLKNGTKLSAEEKKALGLNPRQTITKEFVSVLNSEGLSKNYPKGKIISLYYRASLKQSRVECLNKIRGLGIKKIQLSCAGDERDCFWCKSVSEKEISSSEDIESLIEKNCTCESHCRFCILAVI